MTREIMVRFDLPWDLVEEILSRVPATSMKQLRFTCKRWNTLFKDLEFIKKLLTKAAKPSMFLMLSRLKVYSPSVNINASHNNIAVGPSIEFTAQLGGSKSKQVCNITRVFHCNGLLLCSTKEQITKLVVVNPCTGQTRWIKLRSVYYISVCDTYALGYEYNNKSYDNYKILRFHAIGNMLDIFELKSNSWKGLANIPFNMNLGRDNRGVSLKGNTYWLSLKALDIFCFDFTTETLKRLSPPVQFELSVFTTRALSVFREEQLSVLEIDPDKLQMEIWVSNKVDNETKLSWSRCFNFDLHSHVDIKFLTSMSFFIDEEKKVIVCYGKSLVNKNIIYIVGKHGCRKFDYDTDHTNHYMWFLLAMFQV